MDLRFTDHAQYRSYQRGISPDQVKNIILNPDFTQHQDGEVMRASKKVKETMVHVVYKRIGKKYIIITIYY